MEALVPAELGRPPASLPLAEWRAVYGAFSEPEGIQAELEIAVGEEATAAVSEAEVRRRARASLVRFQNLIVQDPHHHSGPVVVVVQVVVDPHGGLQVGRGEVGSPPTAPRRPLGELVALALEELEA